MVSANATPAAGSLRELRLAAKLSQEAVARRADCSTSYVRLLEGGYRPGSGGSKVDAIRAVLVAEIESCTGPHNDEDRAAHPVFGQESDAALNPRV